MDFIKDLHPTTLHVFLLGFVSLVIIFLVYYLKDRDKSKDTEIVNEKWTVSKVISAIILTVVGVGGVSLVLGGILFLMLGLWPLFLPAIALVVLITWALGQWSDKEKKDEDEDS